MLTSVKVYELIQQYQPITREVLERVFLIFEPEVAWLGTYKDIPIVKFHDQSLMANLGNGIVAAVDSIELLDEVLSSHAPASTKVH